MIRPLTPSPQDPFDEARTREALKDANLPALVMVLYQLTGDERWMQEPFAPSLTKGLSDNQSGGLPPEVQQVVRDEAVLALRAWHDGRPVAVPHPSLELLVRMTSTCMGEPVPQEYARLMASEMGLDPDTGVADDPAPVPARDLRVLIIGAGVSGLTAALRLRQQGLDPVLIEKNDQVGGTWYENRYPGAGVDTPSYLYSWSFFPHHWSTHFGKRDEVVHYIQEMAEHFDLVRSVRFHTEVTSAVYEEDSQTWTVEMTGPDGPDTVTADVVITAVGLLSRPKVPSFPGLEDFKGPIFHSARWPDDLDLSGKRVAVVGTGASAMQIVPAVVDDVGSLTVFQRSPQWAAPSENYFRPVGDDVHYLMDTVPYYHAWYRFRLAWTYNDKVHASLEMDPEWIDPQRSLNAVNDGHRRFFTQYLEEQLQGRDDLIRKALPDYPPFGKRMLMDNGWYAALLRPHVDLVTDSVAGFDERGVKTSSGQHFEADVVVLCTGFEAQRMLHPMQITGRGGASLREVWGEDDATAYLGISTPDFPNLFFLYGPNTNSGHGGSYMFVAEAQTRYVADLVRKMVEGGIGALEPKRDVHDSYNERLDAAHATRVWSHPGMNTYYRNAAGRVVVNMPWRIVDYWDWTRRADLDDFVVEPVRSAVGSSVGRV